MKTRQKEPVWIMILRILLAAVFLFSGFTKAIDPVASAIQFEDYFISFGMGFLQPISMFCAVAMNIVEFTLGFMLLFRIKVKLTSLAYLLFMIFFLILTLWLALAEHLETNYGYNFGVVKDCGCFGKAVEMSNLQTFIKNIFIMIPTVIIFVKRKSIPDIRLTELGQWSFAAVGALAVGLLQLYCYRHLPIIDFSDWKKGNNVAEAFIEQPAEKEMVFIYRNPQDGSLMSLTTDELMEISNTTPNFYDQYEYVDRRDSILVPARMPEIAGFNMIDSTGADHSFELINENNGNILYLLFMPDLDDTRLKGLQSAKLKSIMEGAKRDGRHFAGITNSSQQEIEIFAGQNHLDFPIYYNPIDPIKGPFMVRDAIRSNPGLIIIERGVVTHKYAWRDFPAYNEIR